MRKNVWLVRPMVLAVSSCFSIAPLWANPTNPQVMHGNVQMQGLGTNNLKVTNSPGSVIHWQGFSIGAGQVTQFVQQSASSAVLNRVVGADISAIHGQLLSNGRVFLINPAGILIGAGGVIDTAGFVGSTLNMNNADFWAGKLKFDGATNAGSIVNQGYIKAGQGGNIVLVAPQIENGKDGVLQTDGGQLILAAGKKLTIGSLDLEGVQFEIQAPSDSVLNVGKLLANGGAVGVFAGTLRHTGDIRAGSISRDAAGRVVLKAQGDVTLEAGSTTTANGIAGGDILLQSSSGKTLVAGEVSARGESGRGGDIRVLGERVSLVGDASVDASGTSAGGQIRIGGDYQGKNAAIQNASHSFVGANVDLRADATDSGDGGRVIVWADKTTQYFGNLSARGGPSGGNGGFAEVSGKQTLVFSGRADLGAPKGRHGELLLDPLDLFIALTGGMNASLGEEGVEPNSAVTIHPDALAAVSGDVKLHAGRYMRFSDPVTLTRPGQSLTAVVETWTPTDPPGTGDFPPPNRMDVAANINTNGGAVSLKAPRIESPNAATISTQGGNITLESTGSTIAAPQLSLDAGTTGAIVVMSNSFIQLADIMGGSFTATGNQFFSANAITTHGPFSATIAEGQFFASSIDSNGGGVFIEAPLGVSMGNIITNGGGAPGGGVSILADEGFLSTGNIVSGNQAVVLRGRDGVSTNTIDTTSTVTANSVGGNVDIGVDNASGVVATSTNPFGARVEINSNTLLNATDVSATSSACFNQFTCGGATVILNAANGVNAGRVIAAAPTSAQNQLTERVEIRGGAGGIMPVGSNHIIQAADVLLGNSQILGTEAARGPIGTPGSPLLVDAQRSLRLLLNSAFNVSALGAGPYQLQVEAGRAANGTTYSGTLAMSAGGLLMVVSANDSTVTLGNLTVSGFDQRTFENSSPFAFDPSIEFSVPNGHLVVTNVSVPQGDQVPDSMTHSNAGLPVSLSATGNLTLNNYTRAAGTIGKSTNISAGGLVNIAGTLDGGRDSVDVFGTGGVTISNTSLTTLGSVSVGAGGSGAIGIGRINAGGSVNISSNSGNINITEIDAGDSVDVSTQRGNITVASIDNTAATGTPGVSLRIFCAENNSCGPSGSLPDAPAVLGAASDTASSGNSVGFEVLTKGAIFASGRTIGTEGFNNPLDLRGDESITLVSRHAVGRIGFVVDGAGDIPIVARTPHLFVDAANVNSSTPVGASFHVSTGESALQQLSVIANASAISPGAVSQVVTPTSTYVFSGNGQEVVITPGAFGASNFTDPDALFSVTAATGSLRINNDLNTGTAALSLTSSTGSIYGPDATTGVKLDGRTISLSAGQSNQPSPGTDVFVLTEEIGSIVRPDTLTIIAGRGSNTRRDGFVQTGAIEAGDVSITTFGQWPAGAGPAPAAIRVDDGAGGLADIGAGTRAGNVSLIANLQNPGNSGTPSGRIEVGNITGGSITLQNFNNTITTENLDATSSLSIQSRNTITTGNLAGANISVSGLFTTPNVNVNGAISGFDTLSITGANTSITGAITGNPAGANGVFIRTFGTLAPLQAMTLGAGSNVFMQVDSGLLQFSTIDAGATGTATLIANAGIEQNVAGLGITARDVTLQANSGSILNSDAGQALDLNLVADPINLSLTANGAVAIDANGNRLRTFTFTQNATGGPSPAFSLGTLAAGQVVTIDNSAGNFTTVATSDTILDFTLLRNGTDSEITLGAAGINTSGGSVFMRSRGTIDTSAGPILTGGVDGGGSVFLQTNTGTNGSMTLGLIDTTPTVADPAITGGPIDISASGCTTCNITLTDNLDTGPGGAGITVQSSPSLAGAGSITQTGGQIISDAFVSLTATNGDIGAAGTPLLVSSPDVFMAARGFATGTGTVFADLQRTEVLHLIGHDGFNVNSDTPFSTLIVESRGTGGGTPGANTLNLTVAGNVQIYQFDRPAADLFANDITGTAFQVVKATGAGLDNATFRAVDGDLIVMGGAATDITASNLTLDTTVGDLKLQGNAANKLTLTNGNQMFFARRDVQIRGNVELTATGSQNMSTVDRDILITAEQGSVALQAAGQNYNARRDLVMQGGAGDNESITVSATGSSQTIGTPNLSGGSMSLLGGTGDDSFILIQHSGVGNQQVASQGTLTMTGGGAGSDGSSVEILASNGSQFVSSGTNINLTGGAGSNASVRIRNTGGGNQQVGESRFTCCGTFPYHTDNITLTGGGDNSRAQIFAVGPQQVFLNGGTLTLQGGSGSNAIARIDSDSTQAIGANSGRIGNIDVLGGTGTGAAASVVTSGQQTFIWNNQMRVMGGTGNGADALVQSSSGVQQTFNGGTLALTGGGGPGKTAVARVSASGPQSLNLSGLSLTGGAGAASLAQITSLTHQTVNYGSFLNLLGGASSGAFAMIDAGGTQTFSGFGAATLTAGGTVGAPVGNAGAVIVGHSQSFCEFGTCGSLTLNGGTGVGGNRSDAAIRNLSGNQILNMNSVTLNGGTQNSLTEIFNGGAGIQTVAGRFGVSLTGNATGPNADVRILNPVATDQTITAIFGGVVLDNTGSGDVRVESAGTQTFAVRAPFAGGFPSGGSQFVDVRTSAGSTGNSSIVAAGNQWIRTSDGGAGPGGNTSLRVAAFGSGAASITSGATQLLEIDYLEYMALGSAAPGAIVIGDATATGTSLIQAQDQSIFARSLAVLGGQSAGATSNLTAANTQTISTVDGGISVIGGAGANALAAIQAISQVIVANGDNLIQGGGGAGASASIFSTGAQRFYGTKGTTTLQGGSASGAFARLESSGTQLVHVSEALAVTGGTADNVLAHITGSGAQTVNFGALTLTGGTQTGAQARIASPTSQVLSGGHITLQGGAGGAEIESGGTQTINFGALALTGGTQGDAAAKIESASDQVLTGSSVTLVGGTAAASIESNGSQTINSSGIITLMGGAAANAAALISAQDGQTINFAGLTMTGGGGSGADARITASGTQTLNGGGSDVTLTAMTGHAVVQGHSQTLACGAGCDIVLQGSSGVAGAPSQALLRNLSGDQTISGATVTLLGGADFSTTGIVNEAGGGAQSVTASGATPTDQFGILLQSHANATPNAQVKIENASATAQTLSALNGITVMESSGDGNVLITSAGTQSLDTLALDVYSQGTGASNVSLIAVGDQTIHTSGVLPGVAGDISARVGAGSTGTARIESTAGSQTLNIGYPEVLEPGLPQRAFVIGRTGAGDAVGDTLVLAAVNQTVNTGSLTVQGPSGDGPDGDFGLCEVASYFCSKLGADGVQTITTFTGGVSVLGGAGDNSLAIIDPTQQTITSHGPILVRGGTGRNADASIFSHGPQSVTSQNGDVTLIGGTGPGSDAGIETDSPFQTISGRNIFVQSTPGGGSAFLNRGQDPGLAQIISTSEVLRGQDDLQNVLESAEDTGARETEDERLRRERPRLCS